MMTSYMVIIVDILHQIPESADALKNLIGQPFGDRGSEAKAHRFHHMGGVIFVVRTAFQKTILAVECKFLRFRR